MPTKHQVLAVLENGGAYDDAGRALGIHPGQAFLIATGWAVDGSDAPAPEELQRPGSRSESTQTLSNPASECPLRFPVVARWMADRATEDAQMEAAAAQFQIRSPVAQDADEPGEDHEGADPAERWDVVAMLRRQHNRVRKALKQLEAIPGPGQGANERDIALRSELIGVLSSDMPRHEEAEEEYLWPVVRDRVDGGVALADRAVEQEEEGASLLSELLKVAPDDDGAGSTVESLVAAVRRHVALEDEVFLRLEHALSRDERVSLGRLLLAAELKGPTRPHPRLPSDPAFLHAARPVVAAADRIASKSHARSQRTIAKKKGRKR